MVQKSKYVLIIEELSSLTRSRDIKYEMERCGKVVNVERHIPDRSCLVEFERASDAKYAWDRMDGFKCDGRSWKVDWATRKDFNFYGWKWFEEVEPRKAKENRSPSPARSLSLSRSRSR